MARQVAPAISVTITPETVSKGQMISISANIFDRFTGQPMPFDIIYMEIINDKGIPVWPLSTVELGSSTINKLISTAELEEGQEYLVRVSPSRKLSPIGEGKFSIDRNVLAPALLLSAPLLIPSKLLSTEDSSRLEKVQAPYILPQDKLGQKIAWLVYQTEKDHRVCNKCAPHQGEMYRPTDPNLPIIPRHPHCRCHYDIITFEEEMQIKQAAYMHKQMQAREAYQAYLAASAFWKSQKHFKYR